MKYWHQCLADSPGWYVFIFLFVLLKSCKCLKFFHTLSRYLFSLKPAQNWWHTVDKHWPKCCLTCWEASGHPHDWFQFVMMFGQYIGASLLDCINACLTAHTKTHGVYSLYVAWMLLVWRKYEGYLLLRSNPSFIFSQQVPVIFVFLYPLFLNW